MAGKISIQCPGCLAKLNLADSSKLGKKIRCPKCSDIFVAKPADDEDLDDLDDEEPARAKGGKKRPAPVKKGGKKGNSSAGPNVPLIAGGSIAALGLVVAGLYFAGFFNGPKPLPAPPVEPPPVAAVVPAPPPAPAVPAVPAMTDAERILGLRWMPPATEVVLHLKVADLMQSALLKQAFENPMAAMAIEEIKNKTGVAPTDVASITIGLAELPNPQSVAGMGMAASMGMPIQQKPPKMTMIVRTKKPVTQEELLAASKDLSPGEHESKKYFEITGGGPVKGAGWFADSTTLILAELPDLKDIMDRGETNVARKELSYVDPKPHLLIVAAPKDPKALASEISAAPPGTPPEVVAVVDAMKAATAFSIGVSIRGGFDIQVSSMLGSTDGAGKLKTALDAALVEGKKHYEVLKSNGLPLVADLGDLLLNNLKIDATTQVVTMSTGVPDSEQQKIEMLAQMGMAMASGGGPGNPFGPAVPMKPIQPSPGNPSPGTIPNAKPAQFPGSSANPGQSEPVDAELAEGIPDQTTLSASTSWSSFPSSGPDGTAIFPIQLLLEIKGDGINQVCGYGQVSIKSAVLKGGGTLKPSRVDAIGLPNVTKVIVPFDSSSSNVVQQIDHPEGTLRMTIPFEPPAMEGGSMDSMEGTFKYVTYGDAEEFVIAEAPKTAKRPLTDPGLKAAGVKLLMSKGPAGEQMTLSCGKGNFLGVAGASVENSTDGLVQFFAPELEKGQLVQKLYADAGKFPDDLQIQVKVFRDVKEQTAKFKFTNLVMPTPESKPRPPN